MGRWAWLLGVGLVGALACGPEEPGASRRPPPTAGENVLPTPPDAGREPPGPPDAGTPDAGVPDAGTPDAGTPDAGVPDSGTPDSGTPDSGTPDSGTPDAGTAPPPSGFPPVQTRLSTFVLRMDPADLAKLEANPRTNEMMPVEVELEGQRARGTLRYRGASTRTLPQRSYKIELDPGEELQDRDHFSLLASYQDGGKLTEKFAVDLFGALGLPVPRARYVTVSVNGVHKGVFLDMEHVGKDFLKHHLMERDASVYRCGHRNCELTPRPGSYQTDFEKKTNEATGREDLDALLLWVNRSDDADFEARLAAHVDVEAFLGNLAADALISNAVIEDSRSYWIHEHRRGVWTYVPWDLNNARMFFWRTWDADDPPVTNSWPQPFSVYDPFVQTMYETRVAQRTDQRPTWSVLASRIWDRPALRARLVRKLEAALAGPFSEAEAFAHVDALWRLVGPELMKDPYVSAEHARQAPGFLKRYVRERRAFLLARLEALKAHGTGPLVVREVSAGSRGYVEVHNRGERSVDLGRYAVTNDLRSPLRHRLPWGLWLEPGQSLRLVADGSSASGHLPFTLSRLGGEVGLFDATRTSRTGQPLVYGPEDALWYGPLPSGTVYGRKAPDSEDFERRPAGP